MHACITEIIQQCFQSISNGKSGCGTHKTPAISSQPVVYYMSCRMDFGKEIVAIKIALVMNPLITHGVDTAVPRDCRPTLFGTSSTLLMTMI